MIGLGRLAAFGHALVWGSWLWVSARTLSWLGVTFFEEGRRTNLVLAACALGLLAAQLLRRRRSVAWDVLQAPQLAPAAIAVLVACAVGQWSRAGILDLNVVRGVLFVVGCWALLGLYLPAPAWRRGVVLALLGAALLPLGEHLDAFFGVPIRIATARVVHALLAPLGVAIQSSEAILVLENGIADIDLPCSGVKGIWVGGIFFCALTWIEGRALGARWLGAGAACLVALLVANFARVLILVLLATGAGAPRAAAMVHLPLGVAGFAAASLLAAWVLRRWVPPHATAPVMAPPPRRSWVGALSLAGALAALALLARPAAAHAELAPAAFRLPADVSLQVEPLEPRERELFSSHAVRSAGKWRFRRGPLAGALLVIVSDSFRSQHAPEVCLATAGRRIDAVEPGAVAGDFPVRIVGLDRGAATAIYWFQSRATTTAALLERTLAEVTGRERRWALVSIVFEGQSPADARRLWPFLQELHAAVAANLEGER